MLRSLIIMYRERTLILGTGILFALAAALAVQLVEPRYRAVATVDLDGTAGPSDLRREEMFERLAAPGFWSDLQADVGQRDLDLGAPSPLLNRILALVEGRSPVAASSPQPIEAHLDRNGRRLEVAATAGDADLARALAEAAARRLAASWTPPGDRPELPDETNGRAELQAEIEAARLRLSLAEAELAAFRAELSDGGASERAAPAPGDLAAELASVRQAVAEAEARARDLQALVADPGAATLGAAETARLRDLYEEREALNSAVENLQLTLLEGHPRLRIARLRLSDVERELAAEARRAASEASADLDQLRGREVDLARELARSQAAENARHAAEESRLSGLQQAVEERIKALADLTARSVPPPNTAPTESVATSTAQHLPAVSISARTRVETLRPPLLPVAAAAGLAGLLAASLAVILRDGVARRARRREEAGRRDHLSSGLIGTPAAATDAPHEVATREEMAAASVAVVLRDRMAQKTLRRGGVGERDHHADASATEPARTEQEVSSPGTASNDEFAAASFVVALRDRMKRRTGSRRGSDREDRWPAGQPLIPAGTIPGGPSLPQEVASREEIVAAIVESRVRRIVIASLASSTGQTVSVDVARRLTLQSRSILVIDLTADRRALRAMGVPPSAAALPASLVDDAPLKGIVSRDFATDAEAIAGWPASGEADEHRVVDVLPGIEAAERTYDFVIVDCGAMSGEDLRALATDDAALLLIADDVDAEGLARRIGELRAAGLEDVLLVSGGAHRFRKARSGRD